MFKKQPSYKIETNLHSLRGLSSLNGEKLRFSHRSHTSYSLNCFVRQNWQNLSVFQLCAFVVIFVELGGNISHILFEIASTIVQNFFFLPGTWESVYRRRVSAWIDYQVGRLAGFMPEKKKLLGKRRQFVNLWTVIIRRNFCGVSTRECSFVCSFSCVNPPSLCLWCYVKPAPSAMQNRRNHRSVHVLIAGWDKHSYGYHGDDGYSFCSSGTGQPYGPTFTTGDVIGCCVNLIDNTCFYTKNGVNLGVLCWLFSWHLKNGALSGWGVDKAPPALLRCLNWNMNLFPGGLVQSPVTETYSP